MFISIYFFILGVCDVAMFFGLTAIKTIIITTARDELGRVPYCFPLLSIFRSLTVRFLFVLNQSLEHLSFRFSIGPNCFPSLVVYGT